MDTLFKYYGDVILSIIGSITILTLTNPILKVIGNFINNILTSLMG